ncbi:superoxide dismutase family protein [Aquincola sp. S2]|uniref:Superoxide dismutase [Cu-Zn] n=1 Tax=Pseudaquabacterium terrae TaxID=2732868 RepID=A0ABX2EDB6_9BURK|nr:superoxide dismutase family protein [Aquabacterium terrae]NRF66025.1 superoxide dismutase family protein [Aquabacterium terrae]
MKRAISLLALSAGIAGFAAPAASAEITVTMHLVDASGTGASTGTVRIAESPYGLVFHPSLKGLPPGLHGFHIHENPSCQPATPAGGSPVAALAAGGHFDPAGTKRHGEPWGDGHLGDLPALYVAAGGGADNPVLAPRLKLADVRNRSLMIHAGGDNHADHPAPLGGGGARVVCGVIGG